MPLWPLHGEIVTGSVGPGTGVAVAGDRSVDDFGFSFTDFVVTEADALQEVAPEILQQHIRLLDEFL